MLLVRLLVVVGDVAVAAGDLVQFSNVHKN